MNLAIIPARGGSKRIPRKNIKEFLGKPIISYSIEAAINSNLFDEIMVSTDDEEIANIAIKYGAKVPFYRSKENSSDFSTTFEVLQEVILEYKKRNKIFEKACCIYPCAPLIKIESLQKTLSMFESINIDSVFPIVEYSTPIQRALKSTNGKINFFYPENINLRSQDLDKAYFDAGQFYWFKIQQFLKEKTVLLEKNNSIILSNLEAQDIDNLIDWEIAELKYKLLNKI